MPDNRSNNRRSQDTRSTKLWECPRCGAKGIVRNLSHACGSYSIDGFLEGKTDVGRDLFWRFVTLIEKCGSYAAAPARTRIAFMAAVRFASINRVGCDFIDVHFVLPRAIDSPRFRKIEPVGKLHVHHLRLRARREFDRELGRWLRQSFREYGQRKWLARTQATSSDKRRAASRPAES